MVFTLFRKGFYVKHRTAIIMCLRLIEMLTTDAYLAFWYDFSDKQSFFEWNLLAWGFGNNWLSMVHWCGSSAFNSCFLLLTKTLRIFLVMCIALHFHFGCVCQAFAYLLDA